MTPPPSHRGEKFAPEPLTRLEVGKLLAACSQRSHSGVRLRAIVAVMYGSGLRLAETLSLYPRDIDLDAGTVRVRRGKGSKSRLAGVDPFAGSLVQAWMDRRAKLGLTNKDPVFATYAEGHVGHALSPRYVRHSLAKLGKKAGIDKRTHPHGLRHSMAFDLAQTNTPIHSIQAQLGHASLAVTDRYVRHIAPIEVVATMRARDWSTS